MQDWLRHAATAAVGLAALSLGAAGCGASDARYVPAEGAARQALAAALDAWQAGKPPGKVGDGSPGVEVVDSQWKAGRKLEGYEILGTEERAGPRWFSVRLTFRDPAKTEVVRYAVMGVDPLWVYREEDHAKLSGM